MPNEVKVIVITFRAGSNRWGRFVIQANNTKKAKKNFRHFTKRKVRDIQQIGKHTVFVNNVNDVLLLNGLPLINYFTLDDIVKTMGGC